MAFGEVNELFLMDAQQLTGEVQRFARGRPVTPVSGAATAAEALGELLRSLGLHHYAACALSLANRLSDSSVPHDRDSDRAAAATLTARLSDVIEELRHQKAVDDGSDFAAMWAAEYEIRPLPVVPAPEASTGLPIGMRPSPGDGVELGVAGEGGVGDAPALDQDEEPLGHETRLRTALLLQARQLHAQLALLKPGPEQNAASAHVWQQLEGLRLECGQIDGLTLPTPVAASLSTLAVLRTAFEHLGVVAAEPFPADAGTVCIDIAVREDSATAMAAAGATVGLCGGRIDAGPMGWRLSVPADTDRLRVVVLETDEGPIAVHALQFESWATDEPHHNTGLLSLRFGAVEVQVSLPCRMAGFSDPPVPWDVWRFELPLAQHWPRPANWDAVVADVNGRGMPLLVPQADTEGQQYHLNKLC